jgi:hypothetical protein
MLPEDEVMSASPADLLGVGEAHLSSISIPLEVEGPSTDDGGETAST